MRVKLIKYTPNYEGYIGKFVYTGIEKNLMAGVDVRALIKNYLNMGEGYIGLEDSKMVGAGGVIPVRKDVGYLWLFYNDNKNVRRIFVFMKDFIAAKFTQYRRLQTQCLDTPKTKRLVEHLGFKREGVMRKYTKDKNMIIYGLLKGEV